MSSVCDCTESKGEFSDHGSSCSGWLHILLCTAALLPQAGTKEMGEFMAEYLKC